MAVIDFPTDDFYKSSTSLANPDIYKDTITEFMKTKIDTYVEQSKELKNKKIDSGEFLNEFLSLSLDTVFKILERLANEITFLKDKTK